MCNTVLSGCCIFATKACIDNRKNLLDSNISPMFPHNMANFGPLTAEMSLPCSLGHRSKFQRVSRLALVTAATLLTEANQTLHDVWPSPGLVYYISLYIIGGSCRLTEFCKIHFASKSWAVLFWQRYCTALQQRASAEFCGVVYGMELWNFRIGATCIQQGGHHVGHRPTF